jgi:hypothetical protein
MVVTGGSDLGVAGLAVLVFGIVMVSLYLVVRAGVRAGVEEAWRRMAAMQTPPPPPLAPPPAQPPAAAPTADDVAAPPVPEQRTSEAPARTDDD